MRTPVLIGSATVLLLTGCTPELSGVKTAMKEAWDKVANVVVEIARFPAKLWEGPVPQPELQGLVPLSMVSICYELKRKRWTTFPVALPGEQLKVVTNADLAIKGADDPKARWGYGIEYQLLDRASDRVLRSGTYFHMTKLTRFKPKDRGQMREYPPAFYLDGKRTPADGRFIVFNMKDVGPGKSGLVLRFRLAERDPEVLGVVLRLYNREPTSAFRLDRIWMRITQRQKEQFALGNVYPPDLFTDQEKRNITSQFWIPIAPSGIAGRDYSERKIFVVKDIQGSPIEEPVMPAGVYVDKRLNGTIPIPEGGRRARFVFSPVFGMSSPQPGSITIRWYGTSLAERRTWTIPWNGDTLIHEEFIPAGLAEVAAAEPVMVRVDWTVDGVDIDGTPENLYLRAYTLHPEREVRYRVSHEDSEPTPFRADFRTTAFGPSPGPAKVEFAFLNRNGEVVTSGTVQPEPIPSMYERAIAGTDQVVLSDPASFYFLVPSAASDVVFRSGAPFLCSSYTRPPKLAKQTRVPEDEIRAIPEPADRQPVWFAIRPENHEELIREQRSLLVKTQLRPPQDDPDVLKGVFLWDAFKPTGSWTGQQLLTPVDPDVPYQREEALLSGLVSLDTCRPCRLEIQSDQGLEVVRPLLVFLRPADGEPFPLRILMGGRPFVETELAGRRGTFLLPPLPAGEHTADVQVPEGISVLMNSVASSKPEHVLRVADRLGTQGLEIEYVKRTAEDEVLSMVMYFPFGEQRRSVVRVRLSRPNDPGTGPTGEKIGATVPHYPAVEGPATVSRATVTPALPSPVGATENSRMLQHRDARAEHPAARQGVTLTPVGTGPLPGLTILDRRYVVRPSGDGPFPVITSSEEDVDRGRRLFFPLHGDIPEGRYLLRMDLEEGVEGYVVVARVLPGRWEERLLRQEVVLSGDSDR
ncbi:MAG: hypothetical protein AB1646_18220 [Thermodesulfobacteriota bacterium]